MAWSENCLTCLTQSIHFFSSSFSHHFPYYFMGHWLAIWSPFSGPGLLVRLSMVWWRPRCQSKWTTWAPWFWTTTAPCGGSPTGCWAAKPWGRDMGTVPGGEPFGDRSKNHPRWGLKHWTTSFFLKIQCEAPQWCLLVNRSPSNYSYKML